MVPTYTAAPRHPTRFESVCLELCDMGSYDVVIGEQYLSGLTLATPQ